MIMAEGGSLSLRGSVGPWSLDPPRWRSWLTQPAGGEAPSLTSNRPGWQIGLVPDLLRAADPRRGARPGRRVEDGGCGAYLVGLCGNADHSTRVRLP